MAKVLIDDIGSFPLPRGITREEYARIYPEVQSEVAEGGDLTQTADYNEIFYKTVAASFRSKVASGIDIINYPQHFDMHKQFSIPIERFQSEPYLIKEKYAVIPELFVIEREAKELATAGKPLKLKVCVTGPIELYLKTDFGFHVYEEVLENLAKSVNLFLKNSIIKTPHVETTLFSIDEPSLGFVDLLNVESEDLISILERAVKGISPEVQIHLHTLKTAEIPLQAEGIEVLTGEFASSPKNMEMISKKDLEEHDKFLRAGVARSDIDSILAEHAEKGEEPSPEAIVEDEKTIRARYEAASERFGDRLKYVGPDCGLGSWPSQEVAQLLLSRVVSAVKKVGFLRNP